jgi:hypothetical protein
MIMMHLLLRVALFVVGSFLSFHLSAADSVAPTVTEQKTDNTDLAAKEKELIEKQAALDAQVAAAEAKIKETTQKVDVEIKSATVDLSKEKQEKETQAKQEEIAAQVKQLDTKLDVPFAVAKVDHEDVLTLKKDLEKLTQRVAVLEAASHTAAAPLPSKGSVIIASVTSSVISFLNTWIASPIQKLWMHHQSTVAK